MIKVFILIVWGIVFFDSIRRSKKINLVGFKRKNNILWIYPNIIGLICLVFFYFDLFYYKFTIPSILTYFLIVLIIKGFCIIIIARDALGDCWSPHIKVLKKQKIIQDYPYSIRRHPIYYGELLISVSSFLLTGNIFLGFFSIFYFLINYIRANQEELKLEKETIHYKDYKKKVPNKYFNFNFQSFFWKKSYKQKIIYLICL